MDVHWTSPLSLEGCSISVMVTSSQVLTRNRVSHRTVDRGKVAVPRALFAAILKRIERLRGPPVPAT